MTFRRTRTRVEIEELFEWDRSLNDVARVLMGWPRCADHPSAFGRMLAMYEPKGGLTMPSPLGAVEVSQWCSNCLKKAVTGI